MNLLILKGFNNYFNRKIKKYSDVDDYETLSSKYYLFSDINFNPNDGVLTEQVIGNVDQLDSGNPLDWENDGSPDYIVCYESEFIHNDDETVTEIKHIKSRWFVLECRRTRSGQYQLSLKRDVIADHLESILSNPCFVEKGYVKPDNPLVYNQEMSDLNEIKKSETRLYDSTGCPWLCVYVAKNKPSTATTVKTYVEPDMLNQASAYSTTLPWASLETFGANIPDTNMKRYFRCSTQIMFKPIITGPYTFFGSSAYWVPFRVNLKYNYDNTLSDWVFSGHSEQKLGNNLDRGDIGLTPTNNLLRPTDRGKIVPAYTYTLGRYRTNYPPNDTSVFSVDEEWMGNKLAQTANLTTAHNINTNVWAMKLYLTGKKSFLESLNVHFDSSSAKIFAGGPQMFMSVNDLLAYNNTLVSVGSNVYRVKVKQVSNVSDQKLASWTLVNNQITADETNNLGQYIIPTSEYPSSPMPDSKGLPANNPGSPLGVTYLTHPSNFTRNTNNDFVETSFNSNVVEVTYELYNREKLQFDAKKANSEAEPYNRISLNDAAYDMICIPYGEIKYKVTKGADTLNRMVSPLSSLAAARALAQETVGLGTEGVYDIQLMPYCPLDAVRKNMKDNFDADGEAWLDLTSSANWAVGSWSGVYKVANYGDTSDPAEMQTFLLWCNTSHGSFDIEHEMEIPEPDSVEYKLFSTCKKFRLVSPNYSSMFEFNPLRNKGVTRFNVDFNYRPYNSFIHIAPFFNEDGLYGVDTNDNRGLILQGDFSIGYYNSAWVSYQTQNANYNAIFNREIKNMDTNFKYNVAEQALVGGFDAVSNTFNSASAGSNWGNPIADALGGTFMLNKGFQGQLVGAAADAALTGLRYREAKSFKKDMFNLQLGNVKAMPNSLAKSDAITETFKDVPFIEEYDCTDTEKEIMRNKIKYDGMTIGAIGTINDYLPEGNEYEFQRIKGRMIMMENITDDFHIADDINQEVQAGFYYVPAREGD